MTRVGADRGAAFRRPRPRPGIETAFLPPEVVLLDTGSGRVHHLNPGASAVWLLLDGEQGVEGIAAELGELFGRAAGEVTGDVEAAVADFAERGLLEGAARSVSLAHPETAVLPRPPDP